MSDMAESGGVTPGGLLREARQASGLHIAALAAALKVPVSKLEALESDNYEVLPDAVFVRALASSVCRALKCDPVPVLSLLPQSKSPILAMDSAGLNAPVKQRFGKPSFLSFFGSSMPRPVTLAVLALLAGAAIVVAWPRPQDVRTTLSLEPASEAGQESVRAVSVDAHPSDSATSTVAERPHALVAGAPPVSVSTAAEENSASSSAPVAVVSPVIEPTAGILVLRARSESWVQVRDAAGAVALQRNLNAGESVSVAGPTPLAVVIGRADATEVFVDGKRFDLTAVSRENVARFEVK